MVNINENIFNVKYKIGENETFKDACLRVMDDEEQAKMMYEKKGCPAGRHLVANGSLYNLTRFNCYLISHLNIDNNGIDSRESISNFESRCDNIASRGGGIGGNWSELRPKDASIGANGGGSSGSVSFLKRYAYGQNIISQGGVRRAANMASHIIYHPDIEEFIDAKQDLNEMNNVNISTMIDDNFMNAVKNDEEIDLYFPDYELDKKEYNNKWDGNLFNTKLKKKSYKTIKAKDLYKQLCMNAWKTGEPGVLFYDNINNPSNYGHIEQVLSTNPCLPDWVVLTERKKGVIKLSEINIGDTVFSKEGWTTVINKWSTGVKSVYRFITDNNTMECTWNHRIVEFGKKVEIGRAEYIDTFDKNCKIKSEKINKIEYLGEFEVFDITVDNDSHTLIVNNCDVSNCGEQVLPRNTSCNLASINILEHLRNDFGVYNINYNELSNSIKLMIDYLDNAIDTENYNDSIIEKNQKYYRQIGLGVMGWADTLIMLGIKYGSEESFAIAEKVASFILDKAYMYSALRAKKYGKAPIWEDHKMNDHYLKLCSKETQDLVNKYGLRNSAILSIAPTGSIAMLFKVNGGIEPYFAFKYERNDVLGKRIVEEEIVKKAPNKDVLITAQEVSPEQHVRMQAIWQKYVDASISKTINLPSTATIEDVENAYMLAWELGCKGTTVYRDGCRTGVLNHIKDDVDKDVANIRNVFKDYGDKVIPIGIKPPKSSYMKKKKIKTNKGKKFYFMTGYLEETFDTPFELFITTNCHEKNDVVESLIDKMRNLLINKGVDKEIVETLKEKAKHSAQNNIDRIARLISMALRHNVKIVDIVNVLEEYTESISSLIYHIKKHLESLISDNTIVESEKCPECGSDVIYVGGCKQCVNTESCGWSKC